MALGGCYTCLKYLVFVFNLIFWLIGAALLAVGIWAKVDEKSLTDVLSHIPVGNLSTTVSVGAWVLIVVGAIIFVLGFLGCCGAIKESQCLLATFFVLLFIIFAVLLAIGIFVIVSMKGVSEDAFFAEIKKELVVAEANYTRNKEPVKTMHKALDCCGVEPGSFKKTHPRQSEDFYKEACGDDYENKQGCLGALKAEFETYKWILVGVAIGTAVIMLLGMIFSMLLCCAIREVA